MQVRDRIKKILFPPLWLMVVFVIVSAAGLVTVFSKSLEEHPLAYGIYVLSAYTVIVICISFGLDAPRYYREIKRKVYENPLGYRYMTDVNFKVATSLRLSLGFNLAYSVFKLTAGVFYSSFWMGAVAVYYLILSVLRFLLLRYMNVKIKRKRLLREYRQSKLCGILLFVLNCSLSGIVFQMVWQNKGYYYPDILIYAVAAYTFYSVISSIVDIVRYRKYKSPVISAVKTIRFTAALVSLLSLETAMLAQFGEDENFRFIMTALTGAAVCLIILGTSVVMIIQAERGIKNQIHNRERS